MMRLPLLFGRFLSKVGLVTDDQAQRAYQLQKELTPSFAVVAVLENLLSVEELRRVLAHQRQTGLFFRQTVLDLGLMDEAGLGQLETRSVDYSIMIGEALVVQGALSALALEDALQAFEEFMSSLRQPAQSG
jgi:hypothetical protein